MNRFSIGLTDDQLAYVEELADETTSRADVIRELIDAHRTGSDQTGSNQSGANQTGVDQTGDEPVRTRPVSEDVAELRERVEALEAAVFEDGERADVETGEAKPEPATAEPEEADLPAPDPEIVAAVDALEWDVSANKRERRVEAVAVCYELLREEGTTTTAELRDSVYPTYADGLGENTWWSNVVSVLLARLDGVESPPAGGRTWRFTDENA